MAALLGLAGTGLLGEYEIAAPQAEEDAAARSTAGAPGGASASYQVAWREVRGPLEAFGHERNVTNGPVPTIVPALRGFRLPPARL